MLPKDDNTLLIACSMLENEIKTVMDQFQSSTPVVWMEKSLHEYPDKLRSQLQAVIDQNQDRGTILLAYGICGNALTGLKHPGGRLIVPKFDDCIRMLLSKSPDGCIDTDPRCLYFTENWMNSEQFLFAQFENYLKKYGVKKGNIIVNEMIKNYTGVCLIDTGTYEVEHYREIWKETFDKWNLSCNVRQGTLRILEKLIQGNWDQEFCIIEPNTTVLLEHFNERQKVEKEIETMK